MSNDSILPQLSLTKKLFLEFTVEILRTDHRAQRSQVCPQFKISTVQNDLQSDRVSVRDTNAVMRYLFADRLVISYSDNGRLGRKNRRPKGDDLCHMRVQIRYHQTRPFVNKYRKTALYHVRLTRSL